MAYISFVMSGRNDDYGGDFVARIRRSLRSLFGWCQELGLDAEIIVVEWNPPDDRPPLREALAEFARLRIITVPPEYHRRMENHERFGLFEHYAKNVGIRRAKGEWVLITNADNVFSKGLIEMLANNQNGVPVPTLIAGPPWPTGAPVPTPRLEPDWIYGAFRDNLRPEVTLDPDEDFRSLDARLPALVKERGCAAGDFTLMRRDWWHKLRGYPDLPYQGSMDNLMFRIAERAGIPGGFLAYGTWHQAHRGDGRGRPGFPESLLGSYEQTNGENWGLGDVELPESGGV